MKSRINGLILNITFVMMMGIDKESNQKIIVTITCNYNGNNSDGLMCTFYSNFYVLCYTHIKNLKTKTKGTYFKVEIADW